MISIRNLVIATTSKKVRRGGVGCLTPLRFLDEIRGDPNLLWPNGQATPDGGPKLTQPDGTEQVPSPQSESEGFTSNPTFGGPRRRDFGNLSQLPLSNPDTLRSQAARFRELLESDPTDQSSWAGLGRTLMEMGRPAEAVEPLQRAVELEPEDTAAHRDLGRSLLDSDNPTLAAEIFARAIGLAEAAGDIRTGHEIHAFLRQAEKRLDQR
jgi:tetratricopeptide (TPR) repeat protein